MAIDKSKLTGKDVTQYVTALKPGDVAEYVLLPGDPARCDIAANFFDNPKLIKENREYRTITGTYKGLKVSVMSTGMGCPSASMGVEELANLGAHTFIRIGSSAAIKKGIKVGDLIISTGAMKNEGTSNFYVPNSFPAVPDLELTKQLLDTARQFSSNKDFNVHYGIGSTDDSFYGETPEYINKVASYGCINLEMEASGIFTTAHVRGCKAAAIYGASANLMSNEVYYGDGEEEKDNTKLVKAWEYEIQIALETFYQIDQMRSSK